MTTENPVDFVDHMPYREDHEFLAKQAKFKDSPKPYSVEAEDWQAWSPLDEGVPSFAQMSRIHFPSDRSER